MGNFLIYLGFYFNIKNIQNIREKEKKKGGGSYGFRIPTHSS